MGDPISSPGPWSDLDRPPLRERALRAALVEGPGGGPWRALEVVAETGSTNADLVARAGEAPGLVLVAEHQTGGRGRLARSWTAPPRSSLAVSVLLAPQAPPGRWGWLPLLAGVAMASAVERTTGLAAGLKWPNDVLIPGPDPAASGPGADRAPGEGRPWLKVCGILAEAVHPPQGPRVVLGAGLNVSQRADELPVPTAVSLVLASGGDARVDREPLLRAYLRELATWYRAWADADGDPQASGVGAAYRSVCRTIGADVRVLLPGPAVVSGRCQGVDDEGRLLVLGADGRPQAFAAGDVEHVRPPAVAAEEHVRPPAFAAEEHVRPGRAEEHGRGSSAAGGAAPSDPA